MSRIRNLTSLCLVVLLSSCASATDRLQEGMEAEAYGQWYRAADRYIEALEKDAQLTEARDRLMEVGDSALTESLEASEARVLAGNTVAASEEYRRMDRLLARARAVGVRVPAPADYAETRRARFDAAIEELLAEGRDASQRGQWGTGRRALIRARSDFEANPDQRRKSFASEAHLLLDWALAEEGRRGFRRAFGLAEEAMAASAQAQAGAAAGPGNPESPDLDELNRTAADLQDRALSMGTLGTVVFPITQTPDLQGLGETNVTQLLSDILELDYWRHPPLFVAVPDPVLVRTVTRRLTPRGLTLRPERVLEELGAEFGVLIELVHFTISEEDLRHQTRNTRTDRGTATTFVEEEGTLRYEVHAQILIVDRYGRDLEDFLVTQQEDGPFQRGIYEGDPRTLDLSRSQVRLFDPVTQAQQRAEIEETLLAQLAEKIADQVFGKVLNRIP